MLNMITLKPSLSRAVIAVTITMLLLSSNILPPAHAAAGDLDPAFGGDGKVTTDFGGPGHQESAEDIAIQSDGKIVVAGLSSNGSAVEFAVARYDTNGDLDTGFGIGGKALTNFSSVFNIALAVAIQSDGKIVAGGWAESPGSRDFALARYNTDGSPDTSFGIGGKVTTDFFGLIDEARDMVIQSDGKIVLVGGAQSSDLNTAFAVARYNTDGSLDTGFGSSGKLTTSFLGSSALATSAIFQSDGKIVVGGTGPFSFLIVRYNSDGSFDTNFGSSGVIFGDSGGSVETMALQNDGKIVATGPGGSFIFSTVRFNSDGSRDTGFAGGGVVTENFFGGISLPFAVAIQNGGKIVVAGFTETESTGRDFALVRYNTDGSLDTSFGIGGKVTTDFFGSQDLALAMTVQGDGKIVAAGFVEFGAGGPDFALARYIGAPPEGTSFDLCLQDDTSGDTLKINSATGDYQFTRCGNGFAINGTGALIKKGGILTLQHYAVDRKVLARIDTGVKSATASIQDFSLGVRFTITDRNTGNNTCACR